LTASMRAPCTISVSYRTSSMMFGTEVIKAMLLCSRTSAAFGGFLLGAMAVSSHAADAPPKLTPSRIISLKQCFSDQAPPVLYHSGFMPTNLAFDHDGDLWTGYITGSPLLNSRISPVPDRKYNVVEFSSTPLKCDVRIQLPTVANSPVGVLFSNRNNMLVVADNKLHLIDVKELKEKASFGLMRAESEGYYQVMQSPRRKDLIVTKDNGAAGSGSITWLNPDNLEVTKLCSYDFGKEHYVRLRSFADDGRFIEVEHGPGVHDHWVSGGQYCSRQGYAQYPTGIQPTSAFALEDETAYFSSDSPNEKAPIVRVYSRIGALVHNVPSNDRETVGHAGVTISEDGRRVAFEVEHWSGGVKSLDISSHVSSRRVDVYDTTSWERVAQVEEPVQAEAALALSPDGKILAIETTDTIQVFDDIP
jgi:hypothetical protein